MGKSIDQIVMKPSEVFKLLEEPARQFKEILPAYRAWEEVQNNREQEKLEKHRADRDAKMAEDEKAFSDYYEKLEAWKNTSWWFRGQEPVMPPRHLNWLDMPLMPRFFYDSHNEERDMKRLLDMTDGSIQEIHFSQDQYDHLLHWSSGRKLEAIKYKISKAGG